ncbi:hypothetical protein C7974DRAFT_398660 [Boeremia exigua]|uniref:uncharacterized protein n=1 Tax=Boeremia exigua TaxID=749465 RepID=UPI001E8D38FD|nr:uncharacterized protein C7974DRAFT_398660 [Boeremia exigua]KAH6620001.1 hypothetical protein C7974DRAFT_398660 [Boeremia exigua]
MPIDRNTPNNSRPLKPTLASTRTAAAAGKTPVTPRLALAPSSPSSSVSHTSRTARSANGVAPRLAAPIKEDSAKSFLSINVTPRTATRKSRVGVGSNSSTPNASPGSTPISSRPSSMVDFAHREHGSAQSGPLINANHRPRSTVGSSNHNLTPTPRLPLSNIYNHTPPETSQTKDASSMFFHVNSVRSPKESAPPPKPPQKKPAVFFHANGNQANSPRRPSIPSPPSSAVSRPSSALGRPSSAVGKANSSVGKTPSTVSKLQLGSKFLHADSTPEVRSAPLLNPTAATVPDLPPNPTTAPQGPVARAPSPSKDWGHLSYRKGASQVIRPNLHTRNSALSVLSGISVAEEPDDSGRRSSITSSLSRPGHYKSASLSSIDSVADLRRVPSHEARNATPSPAHHGNRATSNGTSLSDNTAPTPSPLAISQNALPSPGLTSPTRIAGGQTPLELMNELAANARRERKVLDLEISNSSLLAINRSLEKEMRKQKAELKRLRRMSRAGRFSMDALGSTMDTFTTKKASDLSDMSEVEEEEDEMEEAPSEEDPESSESSFDGSLQGSSVQAERDEAYRLKDEKRLQLDLAKHRDILMDSQQMNESLKRCLGWTDQLIKDAQKALDYKVNISDVRLGGRVLVTEDDEDDLHQDEARGLLSPWSPPQRAADSLDPPVPDFARAENRDSGVDVGRLKHDHEHDLPDDFEPLGSPFGDRLAYLHAGIDDLNT